MNRRSFLLGAIATPIAAKVNAVSAALRPIATPMAFNLTPGGVNYITEHYMNTHVRFAIPIGKWRILNSGQSVTKDAADRLPLDSPAEPCDASIAGRDQIG